MASFLMRVRAGECREIAAFLIEDSVLAMMYLVPTLYRGNAYHDSHFDFLS